MSSYFVQYIRHVKEFSSTFHLLLPLSAFHPDNITDFLKFAITHTIDIENSYPPANHTALTVLQWKQEESVLFYFYFISISKPNCSQGSRKENRRKECIESAESVENKKKRKATIDKERSNRKKRKSDDSERLKKKYDEEKRKSDNRKWMRSHRAKHPADREEEKSDNRKRMRLKRAEDHDINVGIIDKNIYLNSY